MKKEEFIQRLKYLLADLPEEETEDAIAYYRDYLEEAGEKEEEVIRGFGSPEKLAAVIRADLRQDPDEGGEFTDSGYTDSRFRESGYQIQPSRSRHPAQKKRTHCRSCFS